MLALAFTGKSLGASRGGADLSQELLPKLRIHSTQISARSISSTEVEIVSKPKAVKLDWFKELTAQSRYGLC
jgi:hypothetical protein